jgi:Zn-dependent protease with chaperone function
MLWLPVVVGLLATTISLVLLAYLPRIGYSVREPTPEENERLAPLRESVGASNPRLVIRTTTREGAVDCDVIGLPGRRTIVLTDAALEHLDDEGLRAQLAVAAERAAAKVEFSQAAAAGIAVGIVAAAYVVPVPFLTTVLVGWCVVFLGVAVVRRQYYAADAAAAERVGRESLQAAIRDAAEHRGASLETGSPWRAFMEVEPSVGARLERLGDGGETDRRSSSDRN